MTREERDELLAAFLQGIATLEQNLGRMDQRLTLVEGCMEEVRRQAKGANNWGKLATGAAAVVGPLLTALLKAKGWL